MQSLEITVEIIYLVCTDSKSWTIVITAQTIIATDAHGSSHDGYLSYWCLPQQFGTVFRLV